ncbi:MAG: LysM peptidoglycan-binding domain-containing protein [Spirochaetes bacterium]|nr:LysM peptidoglycan-binding domain-containing protein [Spirochaetota bacterium]MBU0955207.1 LysM peptidoglycan-binding domain-containing protein [Spirochaetota bacterium]
MHKNIRVLLTILFFSAAAQLLSADPLYHQVLRGDTLYSIARSYGVAVSDLMQANGITDPAKMQIGTRLVIPGKSANPPAGSTTPPATNAASSDYTVQRGDTLYGIARRFNITVDQLRSQNTLAGNTILPGQVLKIPGAQNSSAGSTSPATTPNPPAVTTPITPTTASGSATGSGLNANALWPVNGTVIPIQGKLTGVAISTSPGNTMQAVRAGTVVSAGPFRGFGNVAFVQASDGLMYVYGGLSLITVKVGDTVRKSSRIGILPTEDEVSAYFFVFRGAETIDPAKAPRD